MKRLSKAFIALILAGGMTLGSAAVVQSASAASSAKDVDPLYQLTFTPTKVSAQNVDQLQYSYQRDLNARLPQNYPAPDKIQIDAAYLLMSLAVNGKSCIDRGEDKSDYPMYCVPPDGVAYGHDPDDASANLYAMFKVKVPTDGNRAPFKVDSTALPQGLKSIIARGLKDPSVTGVDFTLIAEMTKNGTAGTRNVRLPFNQSPSPSPEPKPEPTPNESPFSDVIQGQTPHYDDILWLANQKITTGYGDGTFGGAKSVMRQDMAAFLYRLAGSPAFDETKAANPFTDVTKNTSHYKEILWLNSTGITKGYPDGTFGGAKEVTRQDMAAFLHRLAQYEKADEPTGTAKQFTDVNQSTAHAEDIAWLAKTGVTTGYPDGTFGGLRPVIRQDMAAFLHRMHDNVLK